MDEEERLALAKKIQQMMEEREAKRLAREERNREKEEIAQAKFERREARRLKKEAKEAENLERQERRDAGQFRLYSSTVHCNCTLYCVIYTRAVYRF